MNKIKITTRDGEIVSGRGNLKDAFASLKDGDHAVSIKGWDRTIEQNNTMWMWIEVLRKHHGYDKQGMYDALIGAYSWIYTYKDLNGKPQQKKVTTSMMSVDEMSHFMESIVQHAAEENVKLPMPEER